MGNSSGSAMRPTDLPGFKKHYVKSVVSVSMNQVQDGVCHGMCLNWVRKMLVKGPRWRPKQNKNYEEKGSRSHSGILEAVRRRTEAKGQRFVSYIEEQKRSADRMNELAAKKTQHGLSATEDAELRQILDAAVAHRSERDQMREEFRLEKQNLTDATGSGGAWAKDYAGYFQEFKHEGGMKFQALEAEFVDAMGMAGATEQERFSSYFGAIKSRIQGLGPGKGAMLNIHKKAGKGHFVAFYCSADGKEWHIYDPNVGWYARDSADDVGQLFEDLYLSVYAKYQFDNAIWISVSVG